jgi:murein DD-endopeptidase MepM/ murein hydrolase activator NlpD
VVAFAGWNAGHGKQVELQHDPHLASRYSHLAAWSIQPGAVVRRGDVIGWAGKTGSATGIHLHFEVRRDGASLDPEDALPRPDRAVMVSR